MQQKTRKQRQSGSQTRQRPRQSSAGQSESGTRQRNEDAELNEE